MNKKKRKVINEMAERLDSIQSELEDFHQSAEVLLEEEQSSFDNLPEGLQNSEKGEAIQIAIDALGNAVNLIEEALQAVENATSELTEATQ